MKNVRRILTAAAVLLAVVSAYVLFVRSPKDDGNYPAVPDTPAPAPHDGLFVSEYGTLEFNGDGNTIVVDLDTETAELCGLPSGRQEGTYTFLSGDLPPHGSFEIRYDAAHEMRITIDENSTVLRLGIVKEDGTVEIGLQTVTPEKIPLVFFKEGIPVGAVFELQK